MVVEVKVDDKVNLQNHPILAWQSKKSHNVSLFFNEKSFLWLYSLTHQVTYSIAVHISRNCKLILWQVWFDCFWVSVVGG